MKVGFTCGTFDLLHAGHVLMLSEAKSVCDHLIVGIQRDPSVEREYKNSPIQSYEERIIMAGSIIHVDEIVLYDTEGDLYELLQKINPDVRIIGSDWKDKKFTGHDLDNEIYFNSRDHGWSTSNLRKRVYDAEVKMNINTTSERCLPS